MKPARRKAARRQAVRTDSASGSLLRAKPFWTGGLLLAAVLLAVYNPVREYPFVNYDDQEYVQNNPHVRDGLSGATVSWALTSFEADNWHPVTWLSHALDCELYGVDAGWHHVTSVLLHVANVVLLFLLLAKATGSVGPSFVTAMLFGLHPFNVDSVAWIAERKNVLSTLFMLLTLGAYGWYARKPSPARSILVAVLFALGLAAKPMLVTLPFALLLLDYWPLSRVKGWMQESAQLGLPQISVSGLLREKLPLLALSIASSIVTVVAQKSALKTQAFLSFGARLANALSSIFLYVWKAFWPSAFAVYYPHPYAPGIASPHLFLKIAMPLVGLLFLVAASLAAWRLRESRPYVVVGWLWYLGTLVPVIGLVQVGNQSMADRYAYVPLIGIFVIIAWGAHEMADRLHWPILQRRALTAAVMIVLGFLAFRQVGYWKSSLDLWTHTLNVTQDNVYAEVKVGDLLSADGQSDALSYYEAALRIDPGDQETRMALATYYQDRGMLKEAIENYAQLVHAPEPEQHREMTAFGYTNLCMIFGEMGDVPRAHEAMQRAMQASPRAVENTIGHLQEVLSTTPSVPGYLGLGLLLEQSGKTKAARAAYMSALRLSPDLPEAQNALGRLDAGNPNDAPMAQ